jgi:hypothetical protein
MSGQSHNGAACAATWVTHFRLAVDQSREAGTRSRLRAANSGVIDNGEFDPSAVDPLPHRSRQPYWLADQNLADECSVGRLILPCDAPG